MNGKRVLLVDDESDFLEMMLLRFQRSGYLVDLATDGKSALQKITSFNPHIVLLDMVMPEMNGLELCQEIRSDPNFQKIPIVMITAAHQKDAEKKAKAAGVTHLIFKPFDSEELLDLMDSLL